MAKLGSIVLILAFVSGLSSARADEFSNAFEQANRLYEQGKYAEAAAGYDKLVQSGKVSAALYFNLGNALFKAGQTGRAILNYRLAERHAPRDPDLRANLQFARNHVNAGGPPDSTTWRRWLDNLALDEWGALFGAGVWIWGGLLTLGQCRPAWRAALRGYVLAAGLLSVLLALCLGLEIRGQLTTRSAVVIADEAVARYGPLDESQSAFVLRDGAEVIILDVKGGWLQVGDARNRTGWMKQEQVARVQPSR